jgi:pimeloyl-ACP methyl ester carboxylesterase
VIAQDLSGIGDSSIPERSTFLGATEIHELVRLLKIDRARMAGHDIGLMSLTATQRS